MGPHGGRDWLPVGSNLFPTKKASKRKKQSEIAHHRHVFALPMSLLGSKNKAEPAAPHSFHNNKVGIKKHKNLDKK